MILQFGYFQTGVKTALDREMSGQGPGPRIVYRYQASFKDPGGGVRPKPTRGPPPPPPPGGGASRGNLPPGGPRVPNIKGSKNSSYKGINFFRSPYDYYYFCKKTYKTP